jgi:ABC-type sugar transport system ATPase subunit
MEEVLQLADRITVLRGESVGDLSSAEATHDKIVSMMVGRHRLVSGKEVTTRPGSVFEAKMSSSPARDIRPVSRYRGEISASPASSARAEPS